MWYWHHECLKPPSAISPWDNKVVLILIQGEMSFEQDCLVEGGSLDSLHNGTAYREVRQFQAPHHLVRFYFVTRIFSHYMQSVLEDFQQGLTPDVIIVNSCIWDVSRWMWSYGNHYTFRIVKLIPFDWDLLVGLYLHCQVVVHNWL